MFKDILIETQDDSWHLLDSARNNGNYSIFKRASQIVYDKKLEICWDKLDAGKMTINAFLNNISYFPEQLDDKDLRLCARKLKAINFIKKYLILYE